MNQPLFRDVRLQSVVVLRLQCQSRALSLLDNPPPPKEFRDLPCGALKRSSQRHRVGTPSSSLHSLSGGAIFPDFVDYPQKSLSCDPCAVCKLNIESPQKYTSKYTQKSHPKTKTQENDEQKHTSCLSIDIGHVHMFSNFDFGKGFGVHLEVQTL